MLILPMNNKTADIALHPKYSTAAFAFANATDHFLPSEDFLQTKLATGIASAAPSSQIGAVAQQVQTF